MNKNAQPQIDPKSFLSGCISMTETRRYSQKKRDELRQWEKALTNVKYERHSGRDILVLNARLTKSRDQSETEVCPFCGTKHFHGIAPGHRSAHCKSAMMVFPSVTHSDGTILSKEDGYIVQVK